MRSVPPSNTYSVAGLVALLPPGNIPLRPWQLAWSGQLPFVLVTGGKCCLRIGSAELIALDCEKSTGTSMARWIRQLLPHLLSHRCPGRLFTVRSNQLSRPDSGANLGRETSSH